MYRHILLASKKFPDANAPLPIYFRTTDEMLREFEYLGKEKAYEVVVTNTRAIADQIENIELLPKGKLFPPRLENSREDLNRLVWDKVHELYGDEPPKLIKDRLDIELGGTIESLAPEVKALTRSEMTELMAHIFSLLEVQRAVRHMAISHISQANRQKELKADGTISSERHAD